MVDVTARGLGGFLARRLLTARFLFTACRFVLLYLTKAREVRARYAEAQGSGGTIWLDHGPFRPDAGGATARPTAASRHAAGHGADR